MDIDSLERLLELKQEGGYWDFKREWYNSAKKSDLLHDIICMANNLMQMDGYIIIGIDEENDYELLDVSKDENRRNTQNLVDFLKDKKFAGDIRPTVKVETLSINECSIDIIEIKNDNNTPYYLKEKYKDVRDNNIYTRIQDTNTPKNSSADIDKVEWLWKKRFGLLDGPLKRFETFIGNPNDWIDGPYGETVKFHNIFPEYTITCKDASDERNGYEYYLFSQNDSTPHWKDIIVKYHQTILMDIGGVSLDGGRYFSPCPNKDWLFFKCNSQKNIFFRYMDKDSLTYKLNVFFFKHEWSNEAQDSRNRFLSSILLFENKKEREDFKIFALSRWPSHEKYREKLDNPVLIDINDYAKDSLQKDYENLLVLKLMLEEYRKRFTY